MPPPPVGETKKEPLRIGGVFFFMLSRDLVDIGRA